MSHGYRGLAKKNANAPHTASKSRNMYTSKTARSDRSPGANGKGMLADTLQMGAMSSP